MIFSMNSKQKAQWIEIDTDLPMCVPSVLCTCNRVENIFGKGGVHRVCMFHCCLALKPSSCAQVIPGSLHLKETEPAAAGDTTHTWGNDSTPRRLL